MLKGMLKDGSLPNGSFKKVAEYFGCSWRTISALWKHTQKNESHGLINSPAIRSNRHKRGRMALYDPEAILEDVQRIPRKKRKSIRKLAKQLGVGYGTIHRLKKKKLLWKHNNRLKPFLTDENKLHRIQYVLDHIDQHTSSRRQVYIDMFDRIHLDEKWFYLTRDGEAYILAKGEEPPHRTVKHKNHIIKVMLLCAMARPRWDTARNCIWDGKIGIWPIGNFEPAKRNSKNRPKGTLVWKNEEVNREVYRKILIDKVIPAIKEKWPRGCNRKIWMQQDGAKAHIAPDDEEWLEGVKEAGMDKKLALYTQPPNSPDFNLNDLGFFRALQSDYEDECPEDEAGIIDFVQMAFNRYDHVMINRIWLTLQSCLNCALERNGDNDYKIPHMGKEKLEKEGKLPTVLEVVDCVDIFL